jgi:hypothetical protein
MDDLNALSTKLHSYMEKIRKVNELITSKSTIFEGVKADEA